MRETVSGLTDTKFYMMLNNSGNKGQGLNDVTYKQIFKKCIVIGVIHSAIATQSQKHILTVT